MVYGIRWSGSRKRALPILFSLAVALAGASSALGASTSSTATESLTVAASITLTGVPASLSYGSANAGQIASAPEFAANVSSNNASGWKLAVNATDLTNGGGTIAKTNRLYVMAGSGFTGTGGGSPVSYPGGDFTLATRGTSGAADVFITSRIAIPSDASPGAYTGSATFTASTN